MDAIDKNLAQLTDGPKGPPVFFVEVALDGRYKYGAGELAFALGFAPEVLPPSIFALISEDSQPLLQGFWDSVQKGRSAHRNEFAFKNANDESQSFGLSLFPVFDHQLKVTSVRIVLSELDVQKELSFALESAEERFSTIFQASSDAIMILSPEGQLLSANPAFEKSIGITVDAFFRGEHVLQDIIPIDQRAGLQKLLTLCSKTGEGQSGECRLKVSDNNERWFDFHVHALNNVDGQLKGLLCIGRDIQRYKETEDSLRREAEDIEARHEQAQHLIGRLKQFLGSIHDLPKEAMPFVQGIGTILAKLYPSSLFLLHVEEAVCERITGSAQTNPTDNLHILNSTMHRMVAESDSPLYCKELDTTEPYMNDPLVKYLALKSFVGAPMRDSTGKLLGAILLMSSTNDRFDSSDVEVVTVAALMAAGRLRSDADEAVKRELESHLRQSQKMEAVGKLAGGIAHDFNNILSGILGFSSYLLRSAPPESELHRDLNMIMKSAERASDLTRQLLSFSRKRHIEKKPVNLNNVVLEVESIIKHSVAANLRVKTKLDNDIFPVLADEGQIHQVIMNLCINAADAMNRKKGTLTIRSSQRTLSPTERQLIEAPETGADTYVVLEITDTGPGIPDHVLEHLFEPFFTTKPEEEGTGLGLSIVYGIVTNHDGGILVDSELGKGASFTIFLPVSLEDGPPATIDETDAQLRGTESILIVDNEAIIRQMASQALKAYGYQVSLASGGKEALAITRDNPGKFDLMLIDLHMTDQGGAETIQQIIADKRQRIKPVLMSAFASDDHCKHLFENQEVRFLQKPFTSDELARNIRVALDDG